MQPRPVKFSQLTFPDALRLQLKLPDPDLPVVLYEILMAPFFSSYSL